MAEITPGGILDRVGAEIPNFFRDGVDQLVTGEGEYIRSGEPQGTVGKIGQAVARSYCRQYGADPGAAKFGNAARIENACRPYLDDLDPGEGAEIEVPFDGGQCAGTKYFVNLRWIFNGNPQATTTIGLIGPLGALTVSDAGNGSFDRQMQAGGRFNAGFGNCGATTDNVPGVKSLGNVSTGQTVSAEVVSVSICDASADLCGNPPPVVRQPRPIADPTGPGFRFNPGPGIDVDVNVNVQANGTINVGIGGPTINVDPFGGGSDGGGGDGPTAPPPGDIGSAGGSADTGAGGEAEGEAGAGEVLVGLKIDILASPPKARQFAPGVFRGAGYIYMGVNSNLDQDYGGSMLKSGQFFFAEKDNLTHWLVSANNGYNFRVTPYYREVQE